jgi:hypothetical protein
MMEIIIIVWFNWLGKVISSRNIYVIKIGTCCQVRR